ncbi:HAD family hydrolase [Marinobacterium rhizophilum]|uniref:HAD family phosphatase n=1 Tax=Marinobacterium rhizophilum TaxID=420402 RepID=A0ABY5HEY6_9GAMM|nr:HAD family phosphatase [Marinobacterium rhizophilum]UTW10689.1 HAD family phosphatase [Marinobacterium rhizophilum]
MTLQAILFDHDGTLVDSEAVNLRLWRQALEPWGLTISDELYWRRMLGVPIRQNAADILQLHRPDASIDELVAAKLAANAAYLATACFPQIAGADTVVRDLACRLRLGMVSASQRNCVQASLRGHAWEPLFEQVVTGDDVARNKPAPDGYLRALELMQLQPQHCIVVEDTEVGVRAARAAGLRVVAIRSPEAQSHDFSSATVIVQNLVEAHGWIRRQLTDSSTTQETP